MSEETRVKVAYVGPDKRIVSASVNGNKYPLDPETRTALMPAGDAHALVIGEPDAFNYVSEKRQEQAHALLEAEAEGRDNAAVLDTSTPRPAEPAGLPQYPAQKKR